MIVIKVTYSSTQPVIKVTYDVTDITISGGQPSPVYVSLDYSASGAATNITSVGLTMPTGFSVANSPLTQSGTLAVTYANGYSLPSNAEQAEWDTAYDRSLTGASVSGTTTKTLTLNKQDGSTITTSWSDYDTAPVTSVFGRTGDVVAAEGDYNLTQLGDVTITSPSTNQVLKYNGSAWVNGTDTDTGLTSVGISVPTGLTVSNSPLTSNGTIAISYGSGYSIPTDAKQGEWDQAYNDKINSASVTGTTTKTLTLTQQDGGTVTASWNDYDTAPVTSVFGRTGVVTASEGDYTLTQLGDVTITSPTTNQVLKYNGSGWVNGTDTDTGLTSVGLTMPSAFTVSNSPLTSNGTIAVTGAGNTAQYVRGDGTLATFPTLISSDSLVAEVYNQTGATLAKGTIVYINGSHGNLPTVTKAIATGDPTSAQTFGVVQTDITNMNNGYVIVRGKLGDLNTNGLGAGSQLYLSSTTAGAWTITKQYAPSHLVYVAIVVRDHPTQGVVEVAIQNGFEMDELHNVSAQSPSDGMILSYVAATSLWTKTNTIDLGTW